MAAAAEIVVPPSSVEPAAQESTVETQVATADLTKVQETVNQIVDALKEQASQDKARLSESDTPKMKEEESNEVEISAGGEEQSTSVGADVKPLPQVAAADL